MRSDAKGERGGGVGECWWVCYDLYETTRGEGVSSERVFME